VYFEDVFAEPSSAHSFDAVWTSSARAFNFTQFWCYRILTAIFAVPCSVCWGINFACLSCCYIWSIRPSIKEFSIRIDPCSRIWRIYVKAFCVPIYETIGLIFSQIRINWKKD